MMKINGKIPARFLVTVLVLSLLIGCTVQAHEMKTAANGQQYVLEIRDQNHPISADEIRQLTGKESVSTSFLTQNSGALVAPEVQSRPILNDQQKIVAYGSYVDFNGARHEFEYDVLSSDANPSADTTSVRAAADAWVNEKVNVPEVSRVADPDNGDDDWPVIQTKTQHAEKQPYGKLTLIWELRKKAVSSTGKADFAIRTNVVVEPGIHAWPQSSKWILTYNKPFLFVHHDWSVCPNNPVMQSFAPSSDVLGRDQTSTTVELLPSPAFSYVFTKPELTLVSSVVSTTNKIGKWSMDMYAHAPIKSPEEVHEFMMPGSSAEIDAPSSGTTVRLASILVDGEFTNGKWNWGFCTGDSIEIKS